MPFANESSFVAGILKELDNRDAILVAVFGLIESIVRRVKGKSLGKPASKQAGATRIAGSPRHVELAESCALSGQFIQMWCLRIRVTIRGQIPIAQIIGKDQDDVRLLDLVRRSLAKVL